MEQMDVGPFICAPVAVMLNTAAVHLASENAQAASTSGSGIVVAPTPNTALPAEAEAARSADFLQTLDRTEDSNPDLALKTDLISDIYSMFLLELKGLTTTLSQPESITRNEVFNQRLTAVSGLYGSLIQILDLYSKQALFTDRTNATRKPSLARRGTLTLRKPFTWMLCGGGLLSHR
jgi:hypothetical protein